MIDALATWLGERLLFGSVQGAAVIGVVWLACRLIPRMPASAQAMLWWLAALKLALVFVPVPSVPVALLPSDFEPRIEHVAPQPVVTTPDAITPRLPLTTRHARSDAVQPISGEASTWTLAIVLFWLAMLLVAIGRLIYAHRVLRGIVRRSIMWSEEEVGDLATRLGLTHVPPVLVSDDIDAPQVFGLWKPVVLFPADTMASFTPEERAMALCHELMHIRRRDLALGWVPAIAERLFFFHPMARLSAREYVAARESACDAAVVRTLGVPAAEYGRMLMRLGIGRASTALAASGSPFSTSSLKRRLHMLQHHNSEAVSRRWRWAIVAAAAVVLPLQLAARAPAVDLQQPTLTALDTTLKVSPDAPAVWQRDDNVLVRQSRKPGAGGALLLQDPAPNTNDAQTAESKRAPGTITEVDAAAAEAREWQKSIADTQKSLETLSRESEKALQGFDRQRLEKSAERLDAARKAMLDQIAVRQLAEKLARVQAEAARANAEASRDNEKTADFLNDQLRQLMIQQQETLMKEMRRIAEIHERLAAEQRRLAEEIEKLRQSLDKR